MLVQNVNCLSAVKTSIHNTWQRISHYGIAVLSQTQVVHSVQHEFRSYHLFSIPASDPNRRGKGQIIAISKQLHMQVRLAKIHDMIIDNNAQHTFTCTKPAFP